MGSIARAVSSVAQPVSGGSTSFPTGGMFGSGLGQLFSQLINQGALTPATGLPVTIPTGEYNEPVTPQVTPTTSMSPIRRFNAVVDPRISRTMSRPMFRTSRYDSQINNLLGKLLPDSAPSTPQLRPVTDPMGRSYSDPRYYKMGGRVNYQDGGSSKTPPKFIPMDLESVAKRLFERNLDNLTYNEKQSIYDYIEANRNKKAYGGRIGYADGTPAAGLVFNPEPYEGPYSGPYIVGGPRPGQYYSEPGSSLTSLNVPRSDLYKMTTANIMPGTGGSTSGDGMESLIKQIIKQPYVPTNRPVNDLYQYYLNQENDEDKRKQIMGRVNPLFGIKKAHGGMMNHPIRRLEGGISELDLRAKGGFIPIGVKEKADDVPAMLSKNEFVFTADAVRNAGGGSINKGAQKMYKLMKSLENKKVNRKAN